MTLDSSDRFPGYPFGDYIEPEGPPHARASEWDTAVPTSGRFNIVDHLALPGKCAVCGYSGGQDDIRNTYKRRFIDFGFDVDYYGVVGFCENCVSEMAGVLGFIARDQYENYVNENGDLKRQLQEAQIANSKLLDALNSVRIAGSTTGLYPDNDEQDLEIRDSEIARTEQSFDESSDEPGPNDVPSINRSNTGSLDL